jgi:hypothetical protein
MTTPTHVLMAWGASRSMMFILSFIKICHLVQPLLGEETTDGQIDIAQFSCIVQKVG